MSGKLPRRLLIGIERKMWIKVSFFSSGKWHHITFNLPAMTFPSPWGAKGLLKNFHGADHIKMVFKKIHNLTDIQMNLLWESYLEFMVVKAMCHDEGSENGMLFSTTPLMDQLWHHHILETRLYDDFMKLIREINPRMNKINHSIGMSFTSPESLVHRRIATSIAYRYKMCIMKKFFWEEHL